MRKIPPNAQKIFNQAKAKPGLSVYELAKSLGLDYKNAHNAVEVCEKLGLIQSEMKLSRNKPRREVFVVAQALGLNLSEVGIESGEKLMAAKAEKRLRFFQEHGSMAPVKSLSGKIAIKNEAFNKW